MCIPQNKLKMFKRTGYSCKYHKNKKNVCNQDRTPCRTYPEICVDEKTTLTSVNVSAGCGETKHRAGESGSECWKDAGFQPRGAGAGGGRGPTYHRGSGRQNLRPERPATEPGKAHWQIATAVVALHLHSQHRFHPCGLDVCCTGLPAEQQSKQYGGICAAVYLHGSVFFFRSVKVNNRYQEPLKSAMC